jgi:peptidylprolyl isomerase
MGFTKEIIKEGNGLTPIKGQIVETHCTGYVEFPNQDLKKFWSTRDNNQTFSFQIGLGKVIRGWDEGMLTMKKGERAKLHLSPDYAYGSKGFPAWNIPPNAPLMFDVEIIDIK